MFKKKSLLRVEENPQQPPFQQHMLPVLDPTAKGYLYREEDQR